MQEGGGFFHREKLWYHAGFEFDLYVAINRPDLTTAINRFLLEYLPATGFGADKSVGMGSLTIKPDNAFTPSGFDVKEANARLSLSLASFPGIDAYEAYYKLKTKFGKLGGGFAVCGPNGGSPRPFKKPVLMYEPGAVFCCSDTLADKPLVDNIHSDKRIRHYGVPITLPFHLREDS